MKSAGINIGYGHTEIRTEKSFTVFPSVSALANKAFTGLGMDYNTRVVLCKGQEYEVGKDASSLSTDIFA